MDIDKCLERVAHIAQPGLLVLGIWGYFYTVVPAFQNQRLQEQNAKLEIEKGASEKELTSLLDQQAKVQEDIRTLQEKLKTEKDNGSLLAKDMARLRSKEIKARNQAEEAEVRLGQELKMLDAARWELVLVDLTFSYFFQSLPRTIDSDKDKKPGYFIFQAEEDWPKPFEELLKTIDNISKKNEKTHQIPESYYTELKNYVTRNKAALECQVPNFEALHEEFSAELIALESIIDSELDQYIKGILNEYAAKGKKVEITDEFRSRSKSMIALGKKIALQSRYEEKIRVLKKSCEDKVDNIVNQLKVAKEVTR